MREFGGTQYFCEGEYTERARNGDPGKNGAAGSSKITLVRFNVVGLFLTTPRIVVVN